MTSYADKVKAHLSDYRRTQLGVCKVGTWSGNGKQYPHILPKKLRFLNLIESYREGLRAYLEDSGIQLDQGFHHLNSSQAACLNLFWPILNYGGPDLALEALGIGPEEVSTWEFEKVIEMGEHTHFDLYLELKSGAKPTSNSSTPKKSSARPKTTSNTDRSWQKFMLQPYAIL